MPVIDPDHLADLDLLRECAAEAGAIALSYFRKDPEVWMKDGDSPVTEADLAVDRFLRETLMAARPTYGWLSEETADDPERLKARRTFVVDPIDGTRAFMAGREVWCVSVAVVEEGRTIAGVLDCPVKREVFEAVPGRGAHMNGTRLTVAQPHINPVIGGPKWMIDKLDADLRQRLVPSAHVPSLAYRLAMVADGRLDGTFVKTDSHDWDIAAARLILSEAGGSLFDRAGAEPHVAGANPRHGALAAASGSMVAALHAALQKIPE
ncbi:MAG: 3'(2'),5'-bisphosphate nucleotidase CysQ [Notoacmeibacter sp.]|nr:3'(2'),5'-bisphosphate nucleotidase CysQ [Notoacmeibacter sp.]MCC0032567.1 3'(2'),5'-bisphosphate nucleotidase CysQ [Brucellaceae bacterium]